MTNDVRFEVVDRIATITLNRPDALNAVTANMLDAIGERYAQCHEDPEVRAVILTGAGRAFCAGADFGGGKQPFAAPADNDARNPGNADYGGNADDAGHTDNLVGRGRSMSAPRRFESSPVRPRAWEVAKPVIAAINGHAIGIGMTLAMQCDFRFMARDAKWGIVQNRRGVVPDAQAHWTVPRAVGFARAAEILLAGRTFSGDEAVAMGVASRVMASIDVLAEARLLAEDLRDNVAPRSYARSKAMLWQSWAGADAVDTMERDAHLDLIGHPDAIEGPRAFLEKRAPHFIGRVGTGER